MKLDKIISVNIYNEQGDGKVGIWVEGDTLNIIFPKNYSYDLNNIYDDIKILTRSFEKYSKFYTNSIIYNIENKVNYSIQDNFSFLNFFEIIYDYICTGYYFSSNKYDQVNANKRINFIKTMHKFTPYSINNNIMYLNHISEKSKIDLSTPLTSIHKYIVENCFNIIGIFFPSIEYEINCKLPFPKDYCIKYLETLITETFQDDKIRFLKLLLSFFRINSSTNNCIFFCYTNKFDHVWETMLYDLLCNDDISKYYFKSTWILQPNNLIKNNNLSRPDIINLKISDRFNLTYIIDAKYYSYSLTNIQGTLPTTSDINKQIVYKYYVEELISKRYPNSINKFINCFILPQDLQKNNISYLGYAYSEFDLTEKIYAISVDIKLVMKNYIKFYKTLNFQNEILIFLNNCIKKNE